MTSRTDVHHLAENAVVEQPSSSHESRPILTVWAPPPPENHPVVSSEMRSFLKEYLSDEFLLTPKNRDTLTGYWYLTSIRAAEAALQGKDPEKTYREVIRLTWSAQSLFDLNYVILPASFASCQERIRIPFRGLSYHAEIGWLDDEGAFLPVLASNRSDCPKNFNRPFSGHQAGDTTVAASEIENVLEEIPTVSPAG